ncbi:hypothetical protein Ancab_015491, partial [Ancistrocladus abbreviatus]
AESANRRGRGGVGNRGEWKDEDEGGGGEGRNRGKGANIGGKGRRRMVQIQATIISKCLPNIVNQINDKLSSYMSGLNSMPQSFDSIANALIAFVRILSTVKKLLKKIFIRGEYDEHPDDKEMHCSAHLAEMLN